MKYKFNIGRALKLNTEKGINILDGNLKASDLIIEHTKINKMRKSKDDEEYNEEIDNEQLMKLLKIKNAITMSEWVYVSEIINYFSESPIDIDELEIETIHEFYDEMNRIHTSAFEKPKSGGKGK